MGKIATEAEAFAIGEEGLISDENKGVTKLKADALGCDVKGSYSNQQLIQKDDLSSKYNKIRISLKGEPAWMVQSFVLKTTYPIKVNTEFSFYCYYQGQPYTVPIGIYPEWTSVGGEDHPDELTWVISKRQPIDTMDLTRSWINPTEDQDGRPYKLIVDFPKTVKLNAIGALNGKTYLCCQYPLVEDITIKSTYDESETLIIKKGTTYRELEGNMTSFEVDLGTTPYFDTYEVDPQWFPEEQGYFIRKSSSSTTGSYCVSSFDGNNRKLTDNGNAFMLPSDSSGWQYFRLILSDWFDYDVYVGSHDVGEKIRVNGTLYTVSQAVSIDVKSTYITSRKADQMLGQVIEYVGK